MNSLKLSPQQLSPYFLALLPFGLWGILWFGIQAENYRQITDTSSLYTVFQGFRAILPLLAAGAATFFIVSRLSRTRRRSFPFVSPLGLVVVYGLVGIASSLFSPSWSVSIYWTAAYLSVPLVLLAIGSSTDALQLARRLIDLNWMLMILAMGALFTYALIYLDLLSVITDPAALSKCESIGSWFRQSSGKIRSTGVGRYSAIAAIIALSWLWHQNRRFLGALILLASVALLLTTGARTAMVGFALAAPVVVLLYGGRRALIWGAGATVVLIPVIFGTGLHQTFLDQCIFKRGADVPPAASSNQQLALSLSLGPEGVLTQSPFPPAEPIIEASPNRLPIPDTFYNLSGRTHIWAQGWRLVKESPLLGSGFHADRLILNAHMHNSVLHALVQTGFIGTIPFVLAMAVTWGLFLKAARKLSRLTVDHKHMVIQAGGVLTFLTFRSMTESTGAFFGIDWLLLAPLLWYFHAVNHNQLSGNRPV